MKTRIATVLAHITGWLVFLYLPLLFISGQNDSVSLATLVFSTPYWAFACTYIAVFYIHSYVLIPLAQQRKQPIVYGAAIVLLLVAIYYLRPFDHLVSHFSRTAAAPTPGPMPFPGEPPPPGPIGPRGGNMPHHAPIFDIMSLILYFLLLILSWGIKITDNWKTATEREARAEADKASAELSFLKAQINPHFLFNTLNNIYALTIKTSPEAADSILKLAKIMRYITNEAHRDYVPLQNELECIADFIAIQQLRLGAKTQVAFTINGQAGSHLIAPLIMMTYIENAFKYGISKQEASIIQIEISIEKDVITLLCRNRAFINIHPEESTGIGIANTQKRLTHLYNGKHTIAISNQEGYFTVNLTLALQ
ncbi:Histidine kinase [Filimonas lacunae]|uniref:Histidine kinase n=1 Tax=Filimonas lacunae TaxID=477680 RepID=A0A173MM01_9BACT|nr:histidine kinase [Filimonas lacunae]BAV08662.1 two-component system sensor protein, no kinase domain [Filimonas lacunae]SIS59514.1 Histidine kinase [Filimonas lacunae]